MLEPRSFSDDLVQKLPRLRAFAASLTRSQDKAEDLVQETVLKAWRSQHRFQPGTSLDAWLCTILRNTFYSGVTAARRETQHVEYRAAKQPASPDQEWRLHYREMLRALEALSAPQRDAVLMTVVAGLSYEQAAEACGCPTNTMKSRVKRGRAALARAMDFDGRVSL